MKLKLDSKLVKISAYAQAYYSNAEAYGEIYIPEEFYNKHKEDIETFQIYVYDLDGKHSEIEADMGIETTTVEDYLNSSEDDTYYTKELTDRLLDKLSDKLGIDMYEIYSQISSIEPIQKIHSKEIILSKDTVIEDILVPKGTILEFNIVEKTNTENWEFELKIEEDGE